MEQTLRAMKRVSEVQSKRQEMFYKMRMKAHKAMKANVIKAEIKRGIEIIIPAAGDKNKILEKTTKKMALKQKTVETKMIN
jgi:hypothetical protein